MRYFATAALIIFLNITILQAQEPNRPMSLTYGIYKQIQTIIHSKSNLNAQEKMHLSGLLSKLVKSLHDFENYQQKEKLPAFKANLEHLIDELEQVQLKLIEGGSASWSIWQLKKISNNCQTCHANYKSEISFDDYDLPKDLSLLEQADFLFATRQFLQAEKTYWNYLTKGDYQEQGFDGPFYHWIDLNIRLLKQPDQAANKLSKFLQSKPRVSAYQFAELKEWLQHLQGWISQGGKISNNFLVNKQLVKSLLNSSEPLYETVDQLKLLRAAAGFEDIYENQNISDNQKRAVLYNLGLIYSKLPMFFIYELPELYLKTCIETYPFTKEARLAYKTLKSIILLNNTGSSGTHIDPEDQAELDRFYNLAFK